MRRTPPLSAAVGALLALLVSIPSSAAQWSGASGCQTIVDLASESGSNFAVLLNVAEVAGLKKFFADPNLEGTLFAPTSAAWDRLVQDLGLTPAQFLQLGKGRLAELLEYHFVRGAQLKVNGLKDDQKLTTLLAEREAWADTEDALLTVDRRSQLVSSSTWARTPEFFILSSQQGEEAKVVQPDIPACKLIVHAIDAVLVPKTQAPPPPPPPSPARRPPPPPPPSPSPVARPAPPAPSGQPAGQAAAGANQAWPAKLPAPTPSQPGGSSATSARTPSPAPAQLNPPRSLQDGTAPRPAASPARPSPPAPASKSTCRTAFELAQNDPQFKAFVAVARVAGFGPLLTDPKRPGTMFAPTDAAFNSLVLALGLKSPQDLLKDIGLLSKLLSYHVLPEAIATNSMKDAQRLNTMLTSATSAMVLPAASREATRLEVNKMYSQAGAMTFLVPSGGAEAKVIYGNVKACNMLVHVVDRVLLPNLSLVEGKQKTSAKVV